MIKFTLAKEDLFVWINPDHIISIKVEGRGTAMVETAGRGFLVTGDPTGLADIVSRARVRHVQLVPTAAGGGSWSNSTSSVAS